jgi:hypothetical protein
MPGPTPGMTEEAIRPQVRVRQLSA